MERSGDWHRGHRRIPGCVRAVFGRPPTLASGARDRGYERTLVAFDSAFDHFIAGDANAIDDSAKRGWELFNGRGRCNMCHAPRRTRATSLLHRNDFHNIGS